MDIRILHKIDNVFLYILFLFIYNKFTISNAGIDRNRRIARRTACFSRENRLNRVWITRE